LNFIGHLCTFIRTFISKYMHKRLICLTFLILQLAADASAEMIQSEATASWNQSIPAILIYLIAFSGLIFLVFRMISTRNETTRIKEQIKEIQSGSQKENQYKTQAMLAEQKIINLENEKMKIEMIHRDKELANQTMDLIRKNKFLVKITEELDKVNRLSSDHTINSKINALIQKINKEIDNEKQWEIFETAFDDVHQDFLKRLKQKYPSLTPKELKLCAYLRLNISTKEIAPLMNISIRGVEICRYRVRKKLNIDRDQNLTSMIMEM
jgi:DNA-binding CsgD family transcriptional regulator